MPLLEEALSRVRKLPDPKPANVIWIPRAMAETYDQAGQFAKAELLYRELLQQTRQQSGADHLQTASALAQLGLNLLYQNKSAEAEAVLRECSAIRGKTEPDAWATFNTMSMLGGALLAQKKYAEAEPLLLQGYEGMKQRETSIPSQGKARLTEALDRLVALYEANGQKDQANKWRQKLADQKNKESGDKSQQAKEKPKAP